MSTNLINTIVSQIPQKWIIDKIKHQVEDKPYSIVDGPFGTQLHNDEYVDKGVPVIRIVNLNYNGQFDSEKLVFITEEKYQTLKRSSVEKGDLIIAKTGATIGKVGVFEGYEKGIIASSCLKISLNNNISPDFFKYYLISDYCQKQIMLSSSGSTRDTINMEQISNLKLVLPQDIKTQQQIANYLDKKTSKIDTTIAKNKELINLLEEKRTALINQVVTKGLNPEVPMKDSGIEWIGEIPEHWEVSRLKFLIEKNAQYGANCEPESNETKYDYRYVRITDIDDDSSLKDNIVYLSKEDAKGFVLKEGDILFARSGATVGKTYLYNKSDGNCCFAGYLIRYVPNKLLLNPKYLLYFSFSKSYTEWIKIVSTQATIQNVSADKYDNLIISLPNISEQNNIVSFLEDKINNINKTVTKIQKNIELLEEYKTSLIHHVVTGKIDVRGEEI